MPQLEDHDTDDGKRVWMNREELETLFDAYSGNGDSLDDHMEKEYALRLMGQAGLRTQEMLDASPGDITTVNTNDGELTKLRVPDGKNDKYRETVIPEQLASDLRTYRRACMDSDDDPFIDRTRRTIQRWVASAGEHVASETDNSNWEHVTPHDLRRSWAMVLLDSGTGPTVVMELGGWENYKTFKESYLGHHSDATIAEQVAEAF